MSSENATYYSRSMSAIVEISDGTTQISDGAISCDSIITNTLTTNSFITGSFSATALTDGYATISGGNISNVNNFSSNNINSSSVKCKTLNCSSFISDTFGATNLQAGTLTMSGEIKSSNLLGSQSLFTGNTYPVYLGGSGGVIVGKTPAYSNTYLEITPSGYNTWLDFHCSTVSNDFDARIIASAGGTTDGKAILGFISGVFDVSANTNINITSPKMDCATTNYINMSAPTYNISSTTLGMSATTTNISSTTTNLTSPTININSYRFRYVPWTNFVSSGSGGVLSTCVYATTSPSAGAGANFRYRYCIIGNTMYLNYYFYQTNAGSAGSGVYQYYIPTGYSLNTTDIAYSITTNPLGTKVGNANYISIGSNNGTGGVYITNQSSMNGFMLWVEAGPVWAPQQSSTYHYGGANLVIRFDAMIPIN